MYRYIVLLLVCSLALNHAWLIESPEEEYDYVIVGLGQAGGVVAGKLVAKGYNILVVEAGNSLTQRSVGGTDYVLPKQRMEPDGTVILERPYTRFDVPLLVSSVYGTLSPYPEWTVYRNGVVTQPNSWAAKLVGGGGLHATMFLRALHHQINAEWAPAAEGWTYDDCLPYFKEFENVTGSPFEYDTKYRGFNGPVNIVTARNGDIASDLFVQTCINQGYHNNTDFNGATRFGAGYIQTNEDQGIRDTSLNAYVAPVLYRRNFNLLIATYVTKINFEDDRRGTPVAKSVEMYTNGRKHVVRARREIVLCAGALNTPMILLKSGIGPKDQLNEFGIPIVKANENVGKNLRNNQLAYSYYDYPGNNFPEGWQVTNAINQYAFNGTGMFTAIGPVAGLYTARDKDAPQPEFGILTVMSSQGGNIFARQITMQVTLVEPELNGTVGLHSADPFDYPNITLDTWGSQKDVDVAVAGIKLTRQLCNSYPLNTVLGAEVAPGPSVDTDEELADYVKSTGIATGHWSSSCRFGDDPKTSVVDGQLNVHGVRRLRIVDASVPPTVGFHTQATAFFIGTRGAHFILRDAEFEDEFGGDF